MTYVWSLPQNTSDDYWRKCCAATEIRICP